jgi:hypothetical protein
MPKSGKAAMTLSITWVRMRWGREFRIKDVVQRSEGRWLTCKSTANKRVACESTGSVQWICVHLEPFG